MHDHSSPLADGYVIGHLNGTWLAIKMGKGGSADDIWVVLLKVVMGYVWGGRRGGRGGGGGRGLSHMYGHAHVHAHGGTTLTDRWGGELCL